MGLVLRAKAEGRARCNGLETMTIQHVKEIIYENTKIPLESQTKLFGTIGSRSTPTELQATRQRANGTREMTLGDYNIHNESTITVCTVPQWKCRPSYDVRVFLIAVPAR